MCCGLVITSGAGTSATGPMLRQTWRTQPRQIASCSRALRLWGSQMTPPLPPPSGMSATAHFQVIHIASARTVSAVSCGWKRMPPLQGPRESLCWIRKPWKTFIWPSSMRTGMLKWYSRSGRAQQLAGPPIKTDEVGDLVELCPRHLERIEGTLACHCGPFRWVSCRKQRGWTTRSQAGRSTTARRLRPSITTSSGASSRTRRRKVPAHATGCASSHAQSQHAGGALRFTVR